MPNFTISDLFPDLSPAYFWLIETEISEQASRQVATVLNSDPTSSKMYLISST